MKIISKQTAMTLLAANPKLEATELNNEKYSCMAEYVYIGEEVEEAPGVIAVYVVRRSDTGGAYAQFMCIKEASK